MGLIEKPWMPTYRLTANGKDITAIIVERFISLRFTDEAGLQSDILEVTLSDHLDPPIQMPPTGAELELFLGYGDNLQRQGLFICDEIDLGGWPSEMTIRARAAVYEGTPTGKTSLQSQKNRSWANGTKLADMVAKIAKEHGLAPLVAKSLQGIVLPHFDQTEESDISFLVRVCGRYDAVVKPANGKLLCAKRGEGKTASGADIKPIVLLPGDVERWRMTMARREAEGTVIAYWHRRRSAARIQITVGEGEPVRRLRHYYPTEEAAKEAAQAEYDRRVRGETKLQLDIVGRPDVAAEVPLVLEGFRPGVAGEWIITRVEHMLDGDGYRCGIEAEKPNGAAQE